MRGSALRIGVWLMHVSLPALGLWLLISQPDVDVEWDHRGWHAAIVISTAAISAALGVLIARDAARTEDPRLALTSLSFVAAAVGLGVHGAATPQLWVDPPTAAFAVAAPIGLVAAALLAVWAAVVDRLGGPAPVKTAPAWALGLLLVGAISAVTAIVEIPPAGAVTTSEDAHDSLRGLAVAGAALFGIASLFLWQAYRKRPSIVLLSILTADVLLAEAQVATALSRNWRLSWWSWHILMAAGFALVAYAAALQHNPRQGSKGLFQGVAVGQTVTRLRNEYGTALETAVRAIDSGDRGSIDLAAGRLGQQFAMTDAQMDVVVRAADALASERSMRRRLHGLVAVGNSASVIVDEGTLLNQALAEVRSAFAPDAVQLWLVAEGELRSWPLDLAVAPTANAHGAFEAGEVRRSGGADGHQLALPLLVKGQLSGVVELTRTVGELRPEDADLAQSLANQLGMAIENTRLYDKIEGLFKTYLSTDVATALIADPTQADLGGRLQEVTVFFTDLTGFTSLSENSDPAEIVTMLNECFSIAIPIVLRNGGTVSTFIGDALMAIFNAPVRQPDHARRAVRAAMEINAAVDELAASKTGYPRFRTGVNTGLALVGNIGSAEHRHFTAIGDTVNLAARMEGIVGANEVVVSEVTLAQLGDTVVAETMGVVEVKGRAKPVEIFLVRQL